MADAEDQKRRSLQNSIFRNTRDIIDLSQELEQRIQGILLLTQQADYHFFGISHNLEEPGTFDNTKTDDLVNFWMDTQAHIKRLKSIIKDLDKVHHGMDFFPWDQRQTHQLRAQDQQEGNL